MSRSAFISAALHAAILLWALVAFPSAKMQGTPLIAIPVDVAAPSDVTKIKAGMAAAKDEAPLAGKPREKKPEAVKEKAPPAPPEQPAPTNKAEEAPKPKAPADKPQVAAETKPKEEKPAAPPAKPVKQVKAESPKKKLTKAEPKQRDFNTDKIAALLNKIPDAENEPDPIEAAQETKPVRGQSDGKQLSMSVNELDALRARIAQCWNPPPGGLGADEIVVKIRLKLNEDGTLIGYPTVTNSGSSPFFQAAADSAVRAVFQCQPYVLPGEKYTLWRDMILTFDPSQMYRSG